MDTSPQDAAAVVHAWMTKNGYSFALVDVHSALVNTLGVAELADLDELDDADFLSLNMVLVTPLPSLTVTLNLITLC